MNGFGRRVLDEGEGTRLRQQKTSEEDVGIKQRDDQNMNLNFCPKEGLYFCSVVKGEVT